jgi:endonuclease YncB( thermonuclease family)
MHTSKQRLGSTKLICAVALFSLLALWMGDAVTARTLHSYAFVNEDATLRISGRTVHLYGVHIPYTGRTCKFFFNPPLCGSRAAVALKFKIQGFVYCEITGVNQDRSVIALCRVNRTAFHEGYDLSAYLLEQGWALALPDAPFEYYALEKVAQHRHQGLWGFTVDNIIFPNRKR